MSAPNFSPMHNTRVICAFCLSDSYEKYVNDPENTDIENEIQPLSYDEWYDDEKRYYLEELRDRLRESFPDRWVYIPTGRNNGRIYDGDIVANIEDSVLFAGEYWPVSIDIRLYAGYYDGFTLDWHISKIGTEYRDYIDNKYDFCDDLEYLVHNKGLAYILSPKLTNRLVTLYNQITDKIDDILESIAEYKLRGHVMSNGEGFYDVVA